MTRTFVLAAVAAIVAASPAVAQDTTAAPTFTGARIGANVGFADEDIFGTELFTYGLEAGYDHDVGGAVVGIGGEIQDTDDTSRDISVFARAGVKAAPNVLVYGLAGYTNWKIVDGIKLDGYRVGAGVEFAASRNVYVKAEQRYFNYELDVDGWQTVLGVGFRF